jgi:hypothetical protein
VGCVEGAVDAEAILLANVAPLRVGAAEADGGGAVGTAEEEAVPHSEGAGKLLGRPLRETVGLGAAEAVAENEGGVVDKNIKPEYANTLLSVRDVSLTM